MQHTAIHCKKATLQEQAHDAAGAKVCILKNVYMDHFGDDTPVLTCCKMHDCSHNHEMNVSKQLSRN